MRPIHLKNKTVLITGASSGLGREMAIQLARDYQANLILTARRSELLGQLNETINTKYNVQSQFRTIDLCCKNDFENLADAIGQNPPYAMILCAGQTCFGPFIEMDESKAEAIIELNVTSLMRMCHRIVPKMVPGGGLMIVGSLGGILPLPYQSVYSGTKAFLHAFGTALEYEMRDRKISVTTVMPGAIDTEMLDKSGLRAGFGESMFNQHVETCAKQCLRAFIVRKSFYVPARINKLGLRVSRFFPRRWVTALLGRVYGKALLLRPGMASDDPA